MAERITPAEVTFRRRGAPSRYPWHQWTDGSMWRLRQGIDYHLTTKDFRPIVHNTARHHGLKVHTRETDHGLVVTLSQEEIDEGAHPHSRAAGNAAHPCGAEGRRVTRISLAGQPHDLQLPDGVVYVGRAYAGTKGHPLLNPHAVGKPCRARCHCKTPDCTACRACDDGTHVHSGDESLDLYWAHLVQHPDLLDQAAVLVEDRWTLACRCPLDQPCHIDVFTEIGEAIINDIRDAA
ncbi:hypothetical protein [Streptomyces sp. enrichment culture]|uniref:hypothetical protein n=1 Tax=Streptomyces sp. enrichment culture TaxID=1795815 RepID=UPI003F54FA22